MIIIAYCNRVETEDPLLCPHGQTWKVVERVKIDQAASTKDYCTLFKWSNVQEEMCELDYFLLMYPRQHLSSLLKYTSERLQANSELPLLEGEYFRWIGIRLAMVLESKRGPLNIYWSDIQDPNSVYTPGCYGKRFGMTRKRFQAISCSKSFFVSRTWYTKSH